jgi:hypothetical protein
MERHHWTLTLISTIAILTLAPGSAALANRQTDAQAGLAQKATLEHADEAEELVDDILDARPTQLSVEDPQKRREVPLPKNTLQTVEADKIAKLHGLVEAMAATIAPSATRPAGPRGDVRAHVEAAQAIAREILPGGPSGAPVTSPSTEPLVVVDRTALERLKIELEAIEHLLSIDDRTQR